MSESEVKLLGTMDARVWAKEFMRICDNHVCGSDEFIDEELMIAWFANAIMCGFDHGQSRKSP